MVTTGGADTLTEHYRIRYGAGAVEMRQVWPCRCGVEHDGDYGMYDYAQHQCDHTDAPLVELAPLASVDGKPMRYLCCITCGQTLFAHPASEVA